MSLNIRKRIIKLLSTDDKHLKNFVEDILSSDEVFENINRSGEYIVYDSKIKSGKPTNISKTFRINANLDEGNSYSITETILYTTNIHKKVVKNSLLIDDRGRRTTYYHKDNSGLKMYEVNKDGSLSPTSIIPQHKPNNFAQHMVSKLFPSHTK